MVYAHLFPAQRRSFSSTLFPLPLELVYLSMETWKIHPLPGLRMSHTPSPSHNSYHTNPHDLTHLLRLSQFHPSDSQSTYSPNPGELRDAPINFATHLDPNGPTLGIDDWPKYTTDDTMLFALLDGDVSVELMEDTFRVYAMSGLLDVSLGYPI